MTRDELIAGTREFKSHRCFKYNHVGFSHEERTISIYANWVLEELMARLYTRKFEPHDILFRFIYEMDEYACKFNEDNNRTVDGVNPFKVAHDTLRQLYSFITGVPTGFMYGYDKFIT